MTHGDDKILPPDAAARAWDVPLPRLRLAIEVGQIRTTLVDGEPRVRSAEVREWIERGSYTVPRGDEATAP